MEAHGTQRETRQVNGIGPTGLTVAANVARLRTERNLTTAQLSKLLGQAGRPITATSVTKIETGQRKVDVDDLVVLAGVLGVNASALLLPPTIAGDTEVSGTGPVEAAVAWEWADGGRPIIIPAGDDGSAVNDFQLKARPPGRRHFLSSFATEARAYPGEVVIGEPGDDESFNPMRKLLRMRKAEREADGPAE